MENKCETYNVESKKCVILRVESIKDYYVLHEEVQKACEDWSDEDYNSDYEQNESEESRLQFKSLSYDLDGPNQKIEFRDLSVLNLIYSFQRSGMKIEMSEFILESDVEGLSGEVIDSRINHANQILEGRIQNLDVLNDQFGKDYKILNNLSDPGSRLIVYKKLSDINYHLVVNLNSIKDSQALSSKSIILMSGFNFSHAQDIMITSELRELMNVVDIPLSSCLREIEEDQKLLSKFLMRRRNNMMLVENNILHQAHVDRVDFTWKLLITCFILDVIHDQDPTLHFAFDMSHYGEIRMQLKRKILDGSETVWLTRKEILVINRKNLNVNLMLNLFEYQLNTLSNNLLTLIEDKTK